MGPGPVRGPGVGPDPALTPALATTLAGAMSVHLALILLENLLTPSPTRHHELATSTIVRGPLARVFWGGAVAVAILALVVAALWAHVPPALGLAALFALAGSFAWEYVWVEAGQSVPLS